MMSFPLLLELKSRCVAPQRRRQLAQQAATTMPSPSVAFARQVREVSGPSAIVVGNSMKYICCLATVLVLAGGASYAESLSREQIQQRLASLPADFTNLEAPGANLAGINFAGASLFGANLKGANLSNANLARCNLNVAILRDAVLVNADLREAKLFSSVVANADLSKADLSGAQLMGNFDHAKLEGANLEHVQGGADMRNQPMGLVRLVLSGARLKGARLAHAKLSRADLSFADLREADLTGVDLTKAKLTGVDFTGATLTDATFEGAEIHQAIFKDVVGLPTVHGLETAEGRDAATFDR
jgi:uncharacterized protein YjbI with pentapeptide repeats